MRDDPGVDVPRRPPVGGGVNFGTAPGAGRPPRACAARAPSPPPGCVSGVPGVLLGG